MAVLIDDLFDDANGTDVTSRASAVGGTPQEHSSYTSGQGLIHNGALYPSGNVTVVGWNQDLADVIAEAVCDKKSSIPTNQYFAIGLRGALNASTWYSVGTSKVGGPTDYESFAYNTGDNAGAGGYILAANGTGPAAGEVRFKVSAVGNYIRGWLDRREIVRATRTSYASGRPMIQFGAAGTTTTGWHVKRFTAWDDDERDQIQFVGDSMFRGDVSVPGPAIANLGLTNRVPYICATALLDAGFDFDWANLGVSGRQLDAMLTTSQATSGTTSAFPLTTSDNTSSFGHSAFACRRASARKDIIVLMGGINDLAVNGGAGGNVSAATCISRIESYIAAAEGDGFGLLVCTVPNCDESKGIVGTGFNDKADDVNDWILANVEHVADFTTDSRVHSDFSATYRNDIDGVHWTATATPLAAAIIQAELARMLGGGAKLINGGFGRRLIVRGLSV